MAITFSATIDDGAVVAKLTGLPAAARNTIVQTTRRLGLELQRRVMADELSGQVLRVRTNTLRSSINLKVEEDSAGATATVGTNVGYAAAQEYGFNGTVSVRAHLRRITRAFGRPITPRAVNVAAHSMRMKLPERCFLRSALHDMGSRIPAEFQRDLEAALR
jgi:phage gpG-like protein